MCLLFCIAIFPQCSPTICGNVIPFCCRANGGRRKWFSNPRIPHMESCKFGALWSESSSYHMQSENNNLLCMHCTKLMVMLFHCYSHKVKFEDCTTHLKLLLKWYLSHCAVRSWVSTCVFFWVSCWCCLCWNKTMMLEMQWVILYFRLSLLKDCIFTDSQCFETSHGYVPILQLLFKECSLQWNTIGNFLVQPNTMVFIFLDAPKRLGSNRDVIIMSFIL